MKLKKGLQLILTAAVLTLLMLSVAPTYGVASRGGGEVSKELYLIDLAKVVLTSENTSAWFETPQNFSIDTYDQRAYIVSIGGSAWFDPEQKSVGINITNGTLAYMVVKVVLRYPENIAGIVADILKDPEAFKEYQDRVPPDIKVKYVKTPAEVVSTIVKEDFVKWLKSKGYDVGTVSRAFIAYKAAQFIYVSGYIKYNGSPLPRSLDEVIRDKEGDCDDMSRVLVNLLWSLGIPARIEYGYVYLPWSDVFNVGESYIKFVDAGPHAWVSAYIPPLGWVSLDFLAGARLLYPAVITGTSMQGTVSKEEIKEMEEFNIKVKYAEYIALHQASELPLNVEEIVKALVEEALSNVTQYAKKIEEKFGVGAETANTTTPVATVTTTITTTATETILRTVTTTITSYVTVTNITTTTVTENVSGGPAGSTTQQLYLTMIALITVMIGLLLLNTYVLIKRRRLRTQVG